MLAAEQVSFQIWVGAFISKLFHHINPTAVWLQEDARILLKILQRIKRLIFSRKNNTLDLNILQNIYIQRIWYNTTNTKVLSQIKKIKAKFAQQMAFHMRTEYTVSF